MITLLGDNFVTFHFAYLIPTNLRPIVEPAASSLADHRASILALEPTVPTILILDTYIFSCSLTHRLPCD